MVLRGKYKCLIILHAGYGTIDSLVFKLILRHLLHLRFSITLYLKNGLI